MSRDLVPGILSIFLLCGAAHADNFWQRLLGTACRLPDCVGVWCCDDYCPKALPCVQGPACFTSDDYCPKALPCVQGPCCFLCDDYCPKCPPVLCCPPAPSLQCGPVCAAPAQMAERQDEQGVRIAQPLNGTTGSPSRQ